MRWILQLVCHLPPTACKVDVLLPVTTVVSSSLDGEFTDSLGFSDWILPRCGSGCPMTRFLDVITLDLNNDCQKE